MVKVNEDDDLWKKYNDVWNEVSYNIKKELDNKPICNNFFWKPKQNLVVVRLKTFMMKK